MSAAIRAVLLLCLLFLSSCAASDVSVLDEEKRVYVYYMPFHYETYTPVKKADMETQFIRCGIVSAANKHYLALRERLKSAPETGQNIFNIRAKIKTGSGGTIYIDKTGVVEGSMAQRQQLSASAISHVEANLTAITKEVPLASLPPTATSAQQARAERCR